MPRASQSPGHSSSLGIACGRQGQGDGVQREVVLLCGRPQDLLLAACGVAEAQATGRGVMRLGMVQLVVEVRPRGQVLGVVVVAHVRIINQALARFHQRAQAMGVGVGGRRLRTALLLGWRLVRGGTLRGTLRGCWIKSRVARQIGSLCYLHLVEVGL